MDSADFWRKSDAVAAATAANAQALQGRAASDLTRVASTSSSATMTLTTTEQAYGSTLSITAPTDGQVLVTSAASLREQTDCTPGNEGCWVLSRIRHIEKNTFSTFTVSTPDGYSTTTNTRVFAVDAGVNTFEVRLDRASGDGVLQGWFHNMSAVFSPFDGTGS